MRTWIFVFMTIVLATGTGFVLAEEEPVLENIPVKGTVTMINIGTDMCLSCMKMRDIVDELQKEYQGKAAVIFVDIRKYRGVGTKYDLRSVPTQIFFDRNGKERYRHEGGLSKKRCREQLDKLCNER